MTAKELLIANKPLKEWWVAISHDPRFESVCALAVAEVAMTNPPQAQMEGVNRTIELLLHFCDNETKSMGIPSPGLEHLPAREHQKLGPKPETPSLIMPEPTVPLGNLGTVNAPRTTVETPP